MQRDSKPSLRDWVKDQANRLDVNEERLLFISKSRDPMWKGTDADHRNAEWFAKYWREAISGRSEDRVHVRGVHYVMIEVIDEPIPSPSSRTSWDVYRNTTTCYGYLKDASVVARVLGYVPLDGIVDNDKLETVVHEYGEHRLQPDREFVNVPFGTSTPEVPDIGEQARLLRDDPSDLINHVSREYARRLRNELHVHRPNQYPFHIEIWSEKTPPGRKPNEDGGPTGLYELAQQYGVNLVVTGSGDLSYQVAYNLAQRINAAEKPGVILYLSDFDPKGDNMATAMASKLSWLEMEGYLNERAVIKQMAVTADQIDHYGLPRSPIDYDADANSAGEKSYQSLVDDWEQRKGYGATELQSLWRDEERFLNEIETFFEPLHDNDLDEQIRASLNDWRDDVAEQATEALEDSAIPDLFDDKTEWVDEFNEVLESVEDAIEELNELQSEDDRRQDWINELVDTLEELDVDDLEPPVGEAELPRDPLYDSERSYDENVTEIRRHEHGQR